MGLIDNIKLVDMKKYIDKPEEIFAHWKDIDENRDNEELTEHSDLSLKNLKMIFKAKHLDGVIENMSRKFFGEDDENRDIWIAMMINAVYLHDLGKININFQCKRMENKIFEYNNENPTSEHSIFSAYLYIEVMLDTYFKSKELCEIDEELFYFMFLNAYIISRHHGALGSFSEFIEKIRGKISETVLNKLLVRYKKEYNLNEEGLENIEDWEVSKSDGRKAYYIYGRVLYSMIICSDVYSTREYQSGFRTEDIGVLNDKNDPIFQNLEDRSKDSTFKYIREHQAKRDVERKCFEEEKNINVLRSEMFLEAEKKLLNNMGKHIYYLEAPTGSGKTITSMNLIYQIYKNKPEINKIFYIFPFNTLVEQTKSSLEKELGKENLDERMGVINSLTPIEIKRNIKNESIEEIIDEKMEEKGVLEGKEKEVYESALMNRDFLHYPLVLTSHVNFFRYLFGTRKNDNFPLLHLANSVVVIDEIQSYKNSIWKEIIEFLHEYAELLNIKIIIMSATLPNLSYLVDKKSIDIENKYTYLIDDRKKYFENPLFKSRVDVDFSMINMDKEETLGEVMNIIKDNPKKLILIEFQFKADASEFYKMLKEESLGDTEVELLTGNDSKGERKRVIERIGLLNKDINNMKDIEIKRRNGMVLVATQLIEAGVDIDMEIGLKDISLFDSEEQFLGRINRSCKKEGVAYFFSLDFNRVKKLYGNDKRKEESISLLSEEIREILANKNFDEYYKKVLKMLENDFEKLEKKSLEQLDFQKIESVMQLIKTPQKYQIFFNRKLERNDELDANKVWNEFKNVISIDKKNEYSKRKVRLSQVAEKMAEFVIETYKEPSSYDGKCAGIYYIENGEDYFDGDKINLEEVDKLIKGKIDDPDIATY